MVGGQHTPAPREPSSACHPHASGRLRAVSAGTGGRLPAAGYWTGRTLDSVLRHAATAWPDSIGVVDTVSSHTYAELDEFVDRAAAGFTAMGMAPADRVLLQLPNSCRFAVALFGLLRAGAIPVMCLPGHRHAELSHFAGTSAAVGLIITETANGFDYRGMAERLVAGHPQLRHVVVDGDPGRFTSWSALPAGDPPDHAPDPTAPALLLGVGRHHRRTETDPPHAQ